MKTKMMKNSDKHPGFLKPINNVVNKNPGQWMSRLLIGTPSTGVVRMEWVMSRFGQVIPTNWSSTDCIQWLSTYAPMEYLVPDAQNLIVKVAVEKNFEWLLLIEQDNVLPPDAFIKINEYMRSKSHPIVSGLYFTKSDPPEPMVYRGRGNSFYTDWKMGDKVMVDGVPTGFILIHCSILKKLWEESPEYVCGNTVTRRVFSTPEKVWRDPETNGVYTMQGTSDLEFCERVIKDKILEKAGWAEFQKMQYPYLIDTNLFIKHISMDGRQFPLQDPKELGF